MLLTQVGVTDFKVVASWKEGGGGHLCAGWGGHEDYLRGTGEEAAGPAVVFFPVQLCECVDGSGKPTSFFPQPSCVK